MNIDGNHPRLQQATRRLGQTDAFPTGGSIDYAPRAGMDLRTHLAGLAMQGILAATKTQGFSPPDYVQEDARAAVMYADALLVELRRDPEEDAKEVPSGAE